ISPTAQEEATIWYHQGFTSDGNAEFRPATPEELTSYVLDENAKVASKPVSKEQVVGAASEASAKAITTQAQPQPYDRLSNNCSTNCADVLRGGGMAPPNWTSKVPQKLFEWFEEQ
ncbi:MAG: hypothetical protein AAFY76_22115, partial [Cyanobacteria bacterium J06649_11]